MYTLSNQQIKITTLVFQNSLIATPCYVYCLLASCKASLYCISTSYKQFTLTNSDHKPYKQENIIIL